MTKMLNSDTMINLVFKEYNISKREEEIARLILNGKSNKEIEEALFISYSTVKNHIYNLYKKFDIKNRHQLVHLFISRRIEK